MVLMSGNELTTQFVLDVNTDNVIEAMLCGREAKLARPFGLEVARPACDDAHDEGIRLTLDSCCALVARHPLQRRDLLADGCGKSRHCEVGARTDRPESH